MSLGQALADARRDAGMSLEEVVAATRIRRTIVAAIEDDDFHLCGGDFYAKAHIRGIARAVGADPAPLLEEFGTGHPIDPRPLEAFRGERGASRGPNWSAAMAAVLALVLSFGLYRVISTSERPARSPVVAAVPTAKVAVHPPARARVVTKAPARRAVPGAIAQVPRTGVNVRLTASGGPSWVNVTNAAGKPLFQGNVALGASRTFTDPVKVRLVVGNAGAVTLVVNGKSLGTPGKAGTVARVEFGPGDPAAG